MTVTTLRVQGMTCQHCVSAVTQALQSKDGVTQANVDLDAGRARVEHDGSRVTPRELAAAVADEGYEAEEVT